MGTQAAVQEAAGLLEFRGITKQFPGVLALDKVSFGIPAGEIHALVGENGAGKSTLIKILTGVTAKDDGDILIEGRPVMIRHVSDAIRLGIRCISQELPLAGSLSVADNIFLGQELRNTFLVNDRKQREFVKKYFKEYSLEINPSTPVGKLSVSLQQIVAIIKATMTDLKLLLMDEPTATLGEKEIRTLFSFMDKMRQKGLTILYISHRLDEIFEIADKVTVLRDGKYQGTNRIKDISKDHLISMMSGKDIHDSSLVYDSSRVVSAQPVLDVRNLGYEKLLTNISFTVQKGEIFGICGLVGAGKTELLKCICGLYKRGSGTITLEGKSIKDGRRSSALHFGLVPEDRKGEGLFLDLPVLSNITIASLRKLLGFIFIRKRKEARLGEKLIADLGVKVSSAKRHVRVLSGGNQQKVVFAKWVSAGRKFVMLDEPTRGVDVFGKLEIYKLINKLSREGNSIIISSSEIPEVLAICDRVGVMHHGSLVRIFKRNEFSKEAVLRAMIAEG
ncbi:MAG: sugar ABC transporter ATP-binding protein [Spirochaetia bacterium]